MWTPTLGTTDLSEEEEEVAQILAQLPLLVSEYKRHRRGLSLCWASKRKRSRRSVDPLAGCGPVVVSSPASPLLFSPSGEDETAAGHKAPSTITNPLKNAKRRKEWLIEQSKLVSSITAEGSNLKQILEEAKVHRQRLKAMNSWMKEMRLKVFRDQLVLSGDSQIVQPTSTYRPKEAVHCSSMVSCFQFGDNRLLKLGGNLADCGFKLGGNLADQQLLIARRAQPRAWNTKSDSTRWVVPDLNSVAEEKLELGLESNLQHNMYKQARKKRLEIRRKERMTKRLR